MRECITQQRPTQLHPGLQVLLRPLPWCPEEVLSIGEGGCGVARPEKSQIWILVHEPILSSAAALGLPSSLSFPLTTEKAFSLNGSSCWVPMGPAGLVPISLYVNMLIPLVLSPFLSRTLQGRVMVQLWPWGSGVYPL